jgi:hypothetical protein
VHARGLPGGPDGYVLLLLLLRGLRRAAGGLVRGRRQDQGRPVLVVASEVDVLEGGQPRAHCVEGRQGRSALAHPPLLLGGRSGHGCGEEGEGPNDVLDILERPLSGALGGGCGSVARCGGR